MKNIAAGLAAAGKRHYAFVDVNANVNSSTSNCELWYEVMRLFYAPLRCVLHWVPWRI